MRSPVADLLGELSRTFERLGVGWYVFGAQAAVIHGASRLTIDVDVTVLLGDRETRILTEALVANGFTLTFDDPEFIEQTRVIASVHPPSGLSIDVVLGGPGMEQLFLEQAELHEIQGVSVPVARAADIIVMKVLAGRPKDHDDVVAILEAQPDLPVDEVRRGLALLEDALGQSDLLPAFEGDLVRARDEDAIPGQDD